LVLWQWIEPANDRSIAWARETYECMQPLFASARYVNDPDADETADPLAAAYGAITGVCARSSPSMMQRTSFA